MRHNRYPEMLCLKAGALGRGFYAFHGVVLPVNLGISIQRAMQKGGRSGGSDPSSSSDGSASCSGFEDTKSGNGGRGTDKSSSICHYRCQLEQEVQKLQMQLQQEIDLHVLLANAIRRKTLPSVNSPSRLPDKAQELLANIASLEITVSKLEEELVVLQFQLSHERNKRHIAENCLKYMSPLTPEPLPSCFLGYTWEGVSVSCNGTERETVDASNQQSDVGDLKSFSSNLWQSPNQLSEEMVRCMRNIFLCLSESSTVSSKISSSESANSHLPVGRCSRSSLASSSDSSIMPSSVWSSLTDQSLETQDLKNTFDPYQVSGKINWKNVGAYSSAAEMSWMSVGKAQLEYASVALKGFRFLVEQLAKVNLAQMNGNERLAFWINLYNTLIMHAYLAYGVPKSDIKLFALMQKASYTVGGQSFSAAEIEFVILKMKPPSYRPQIALILALQKFKISEEHWRYSIDSPEPLVVFALSCGMYSSPAVRIFTAKNVRDELQNSMRDYIRAYVGINDRGKLLVPKLLYCFAKGIVEDSLLVDWICQYLSPDQVAIVRDTASQQKPTVLGVQSFSIIPLDTRFRYLFLPDSKSSQIFS